MIDDFDWLKPTFCSFSTPTYRRITCFCASSGDSQGHHHDDGQMQRVQIFQALPVLLLVLLTLASNFAAKDGKKHEKNVGCSDRRDGLSENAIIFAQDIETGWWFQTFLVVHHIWDVILRISRWLKHVKTTNQIMIQIDLLPASP